MLTHLAFIYLDDLSFFGFLLLSLDPFPFLSVLDRPSYATKNVRKILDTTISDATTGPYIDWHNHIARTINQQHPAGRTEHDDCLARFAETNLFAVINGVISRACCYYPERLSINVRILSHIR